MGLIETGCRCLLDANCKSEVIFSKVPMYPRSKGYVNLLQYSLPLLLNAITNCHSRSMSH